MVEAAGPGVVVEIKCCMAVLASAHDEASGAGGCFSLVGVGVGWLLFDGVGIGWLLFDGDGAGCCWCLREWNGVGSLLLDRDVASRYFFRGCHGAVSICLHA